MAAPAAGFEKGRIKKLQDEREAIQKKTFTKWMNSFLDKVGLHVDDLFTDLSDGRLLIRLLEVISGDKIGYVGRGKLRINKIENVGKAIHFLHQKKVKLESIGAEDIVDGNPRLILGLMWTIILRFQIEDIQVEDESMEMKSAKEALLLWCQRKTAGYPGVSVTNFNTSWRSGLAFNAIIHKHRPDLVDYSSLRPGQHVANLNNAFDVAEKQLGLSRLLDAEDVDVPRPDDKSVMTYLVSYYHYFSKMKAEETGGRRLNKVIGMMVDIENMKEEYDTMASNLLAWIEKTIQFLSDRQLPNSLPEMQKLMTSFKTYRTIEKPPKYTERSNLEIQLFNIQMKLRAARQKTWYPPEGKLVSDINKAWVRLEGAEHEREVALRKELMRQEKLEQLAEKFNRKASLRESWLKDMGQVLDELGKRQDVHAADAALKRHEAISADIQAGEVRIQVVRDIGKELSQERFHDLQTIQSRGQVIETMWEALIKKLEQCRRTLSRYHDLMSVFADIDDCLSDMIQIEVSLKSEDYGKHLLGVQDLLQKHTLSEADVTTLTERARSLKSQVQKFMEGKHPDSDRIVQKTNQLDTTCQKLQTLSSTRLTRLQESLKVQEFYLRVEEEEAWIREKEPLASSTDFGRDRNTVMQLQQKHQALEAEVQGQHPHFQSICGQGEKLRSEGHLASKSIGARVAGLQEKWRKLSEMVTSRKAKLEEAAQCQQYHSDANQAEAWMAEKEPLVTSSDYGKDEASAKSLLQSHEKVENEVKAYNSEIERLKELSKKAIEGATASLAFDRLGVSSPTEEEDSEEVEVEYEEEELQQQEVEREVVTEALVPQVKTLFRYQGQGMGFEKGETFILVSKTNKDWWCVRRQNGQEGFVPANYVKEADPVKVKKVTKKKEIVSVPMKVKRKKMEKRRRGGGVPRRGTLGRRGRGGASVFGAVKSDSQNIAGRQQSINSTYDRLLHAAENRHLHLRESISQFSLFRECDEVESWIKEKDAIIRTEEKGTAKERMEAMQKKYDTFVTDLAVTSVRVKEIKAETEKMVKTGHSQARKIQSRQKQLHNMWEGLQRLKSSKEQALLQAQNMLKLQEMCDETHSWINEKDQALSIEDCGRDLVSVQALQRRHQALERELAPVEDRLSKLRKMARNVVAANPQETRPVNEQQSAITARWEKLKVKAATRKAQLDNAYLLQTFLADSRDMLKWCSDTYTQLDSKELAKDLPGAEEMAERHQEMKTEINGKEERFDQLQSLGKRVSASEPSSSEVRDRMRQLSQERASLREAWEGRNRMLKQCNELQLFLRDSEQVDTATAAQEAFLSNDDLGTSVDSVVELIKKHADFESTAVAHDERIKTLSDQANKLVHSGHYDIARISERRDAVVSRRQRVKVLSSERAAKLQASQEWQRFHRDADEMSTWIHEKMKVACDESYRDPTNLQSKLQKHQAFDAELSANKGSVDAVCKTGSDLVSKEHYRSGEAQTIVQGLITDWKELTQASKEKGIRLHEAWALQEFQGASEDEVVWMRDAEALLSTDDIGTDLQGVRFLLKKHQQLESDLAVHGEQVEALSVQAAKLVEEKHFDSDGIKRRVEEVTRRFSKLSEPSAMRRQQLEDSLRLQQFCRDTEDGLQWIKEHKPSAESNDFGKSLFGVQNLQKKHQALINELSSYDASIEEVEEAAQELLDMEHFASDTIEEQRFELKRKWKELKTLAAQRTQKLCDALEAQKYYQDADEADVWMNDKAGIAANADYGASEDKAVKALKKHKVLEEDVEKYVAVVEGLESEARRLIAAAHFDSTNISARQAQLDEQLAGLQTLTAARRQKLEESIKLHQYRQDVEEVVSWLKEKEGIASSDDYGNDFDHLLVLQKKFDDFKRDVNASTERYTAANSLARRLVAEGHSDTVLIKEKQDIMRAGWTLLQDLIQSRGKKLAGAYEIHKFNRDARELLGRIKEKENSIPLEDLGRSIATVQVLQRKHESFEREVVALGNKVRELSNEALHLSASYPGANATAISTNMEEVQLGWDSLQVSCTARKKKLRAASDLQKFLGSVRDLVIWIHDMNALISTDELVRSVSGAEALIAKHNEHKAEMDAREDSVTQVTKVGRKLIQQGHYAKVEIQDRVSDLKRETAAMQDLWREHKLRLDQMLQFQLFLRDAKGVDDMSAAHEVQLASDKLGASVDECDALLKKHEAFERLIISQEEKVTAMNDFAEQLCSELHYESSEIRRRQAAVLERRTKVKAYAAERRSTLEDSQKLMLFLQNVMEAEAWITEKLQVANDESFRDPTNLENKLQKHHEFEAEVNANEQRIQTIAQTGESLVHGGHYASDEIEERVEELFEKWDGLREATERKGQGLNESLSLVHFNRKVDAVQSLIRDRIAVASSQETGRDLEHCQVLVKKFDEFQTELAVDKANLDEVNGVAMRLVQDGHSGAHIIEEHQATLNGKWQELVLLGEERKKLLRGAEQVHKFVRDTSETNDRMTEKAKALLTDDYGKDLASVDTLIRRHDELERDLTVIENKLDHLDHEAQRLIEEQPASMELIEEKQTEIIESWEQLTQRADERRRNLEQSRELQRFLADLRDLLLWAKDIHDRITTGELAKSVPEAERLLEQHQERKSEIDAREVNFTQIEESGQCLVADAHYATAEIQARLSSLEEEHNRLLESWKRRQELFTQCHELQLFLRDAEQRDAWISTKEGFLANEDLGDTLDSVEALVKKHEDFKKSLEAQEEKIHALNTVAQKLMAAGHYDAVAIGNRRDAVMQRYARLHQSSKERTCKLEDSKKLQQFLRDVDEAEGWIAEKLQTASDESYRDPTNLQRKLQKHQAFEAELSANKGRVESVQQTGEELTDASHYASHEIEGHVETITAHWHDLWEKTAERGQKLKEAQELQQFLRVVEDIEDWIADMEGQLASEDMGKDLIGVNNLIKKHQLLEGDIQAHQDMIDDVMARVRGFRDASHFQIDLIEDRGRELVAKYCQLEDPMAHRHQQLEDSLKLHQFLRDADDEIDWVREREPLASSDARGNSLTAVQSLIKKHETLLAELTSHEAVIQPVVTTARDLISSSHFAAERIEEKRKELLDAWSSLQAAAELRMHLLDDSIEVQQYYAKVSETESWMNDKKPLVAHEEYGKDEDGTQALLKKHEAVELEIEGYAAKIEELVAESGGLTSRKHFDSETIAEKQDFINGSYAELQQLASTRKLRLTECKQLHTFNRECDEVEQWIAEKEVVAANEDLGKDLEHVESLQKRFSDFVHNILASEERVHVITRMADSLIQASHTDSQLIEDRKTVICQLWKDLKDLTEARSMALEGAKEIHTFDRDAADTRERVQEKDTALSDDYGKDLVSVQALQRKHEGFERDLAALEKNVTTLSLEARRLSSVYTDRSSHVNEKEEEVLMAWKTLLARSQARTKKLVQAEQLQRYLNTFRDLSSWSSDMIAVLTADELPQDVAGAEAILANHFEHKAEIDARERSFKSFLQQGEVLVNAGHYASQEIREKMSYIQLCHNELLETWEQRRDEFEQNHDIQVFQRDAEQADAWIAMRETLLSSDDVGDSLDTVEELLKQQEDFEKTLAAQEEKFLSLNRETKVEEKDRKNKEEEEKRRMEEERRRKEQQEREERERLEAEKRKREEEARMIKAAEAEALRKKQQERERQLAEAKVKEEEQKRQEREAQLFASLGAHPAPTFGTHPEGAFATEGIEKEGALQRKNELDEGGRKAAMRSWKQYYAVLSGPLLNFYKEKRDFQHALPPACPPINVTHGTCEFARDYQKRKNALRLKLPSGAEYLFVARDEGDVQSWVTAINAAIHTPAAAVTRVSPPAVTTAPSATRTMRHEDSPPETLPPPPPASPLPQEEGAAATEIHGGQDEAATDVPPAHEQGSATQHTEDKKRKKSRFKMFGASRKL